ncbi:MAG: hypothetical protein ABIQ57_00505 [Candidatus Kapaibacterium sp.]
MWLTVIVMAFACHSMSLGQYLGEKESLIDSIWVSQSDDHAVYASIRLLDWQNHLIDNALLLAQPVNKSGLWRCSFNATRRVYEIRYPYPQDGGGPYLQGAGGVPIALTRLTIIHKKYGVQERYLLPSYTSFEGIIDVYCGSQEDHVYVDGLRELRYTPRPDLICVVFKESGKARENALRRLTDSLGLVDITMRDTLFDHMMIARAYSRGVRLYRKRDSTDFPRYHCRELAVLRQNPLVDRAGMIANRGDGVLRAYDNRVTLVPIGDVSDDLKRLVLSEGGKVLRLGMIEPYWLGDGTQSKVTVECDIDIGYGIDDIVHRLLASGQFVFVSNMMFSTF